MKYVINIFKNLLKKVSEQNPHIRIKEQITKLPIQMHKPAQDVLHKPSRPERTTGYSTVIPLGACVTFPWANFPMCEEILREQ